MAYDFAFKIIIVGEAGVGKSCLLCRYADDVFSENYMSTIGVDFKVRTLDVNGSNVKLNIWDSAGQERFKTIVSTYYRGAHGICLVYDITDEDSFIKVKDWLKDVAEQASPYAIKLLIGSKGDLESQRRVDFERVKEFASDQGINVIETSARTGVNVEQAFMQMTHMLLKQAGGDGLKDDTEFLLTDDLSHTSISSVTVGRMGSQNNTPCCT